MANKISRIKVGNVTYDVAVPEGYVYMGIAHVSDAAFAPVQNTFYIATEVGTYNGYGNLTVASDEVAIFKYDTNWKKDLTNIVNNETLYNISDGNINVKVTYSEPTYVLKHINAGGGLQDNYNKNVTFNEPVLALKGSQFYTDGGYKYQYALYDINTRAFIERVQWKDGNIKTIINADCYIRVEISDLEESVLPDTSISSHLHLRLYRTKDTLNDVVDRFEGNSTSLEYLNSGRIDTSTIEKINGIIADGKWNALSPGYSHLIIPFAPNTKCTISANLNLNAAYCFLKSYSAPKMGVTPDFATGYTRAIDISKGEIIEVVSPSDTRYLYILAEVDSYNRIPTSIRYEGIVNKIIDEAALDTNLDLSEYELRNGIIAAGKWDAIGPLYQHIIIPTNNNNKYTFTANNNANSGYCFLKTYTLPIRGVTPDYATGYSKTIDIPRGASVDISAPSDANYLYILANVEGTDRRPSSLTQNGVIATIANEEISKEVSNINRELNDSFYQLSQQGDNLLSLVGENTIVGKKITIAHPDKYSCWPFIGKVGNRLVCTYTKALEHEDLNLGAIYARVSANALVWTPKKMIIDTPMIRDGITGKGNDNSGNLLIFNRVGYPSSAGTVYEVHKTSDGFNFEKIASNVFGAGHIGDIINVPNVGLVAFFNTYGNSRSWGKLVSADNGVTWTTTTIENNLDATECPFEISAQYLGNGRILAIGRYDAYTGTQALWQMQSSDYGNTWTRVATNLVFGGGNTPSLLYNETTGMLDLFVYQRSQGKLFHIQNSVESVWNNASNWSNGVVIANGTTGQDAGNVNAVEYNGKKVVSYYSGSPTETGVYAVIVA